MSISSASSRTSGTGARRAGSWLMPAILAVTLHLLVLLCVNGQLQMPLKATAGESANEKIISASLQPSVVRIAPAPVTPRPAPAPAPRKPRQPAPPVQPAPAEASVEAAPAQAEIVAAPSAAPPAPTEPPEAPEPSPEPEQPVVAEALPAPAPAEPVAQFRVSPPPPVTLRYDVEKIAVDGANMSGRGSISWQVQGGQYVIAGDAGILFISALSFKSEGEIDNFGIAPKIYREKRFRRSETNTHFRREPQVISFSASEKSYPRQGGEQDRASIIWQLAGIGRGDSGKMTEGAEIDIFVAGVRDGEIWQIRVLGKEEIEIGPGKTSAWHLVRAPRPGSYDQKLDIWLAPELEWYPVKLRYTETNGDYLDLSLSSLATPGAR